MAQIIGAARAPFRMTRSLAPGGHRIKRARGDGSPSPGAPHARGGLALAVLPVHLQAMGIFDRMGKVISSNVNSLLDKAEDQKKLLDLNLEEMDEQLKRAQQEVISAVAAEKQLKKKCDDLGGEQGKWDKRAELALKSGDEALAREA